MHDAEVESLGTVFRMNIALWSQRSIRKRLLKLCYLINTTYVDDRLRIYRGEAVPGSTRGNTSGIGGETLRVFIRKEDNGAVAVEGVVTANVEAVNSDVEVGVDTKDEEDTSVACLTVPDRVVEALRKLTGRHLDWLTLSSISFPTV